MAKHPTAAEMGVDIAVTGYAVSGDAAIVARKGLTVYTALANGYTSQATYGSLDVALSALNDCVEALGIDEDEAAELADEPNDPRWPAALTL